MWKLEETEQLVRGKFGLKQLEDIKPVLQSLYYRQAYASYHFQEVLRLYSEFCSEYLEEDEQLDHLIEDSTLEFNALMERTGAHAVACLQSLHAIADILSHAIYFSLNLKSVKSLKDGAICIGNVMKLMDGKGEFQSIHENVDALVRSDDYLYLEAAVNLSKHRRVVVPCLPGDWDDSERDTPEIYFMQFTHKEKKYKQRSIKSAVVPIYEEITRLVIAVGHDVNAHLRKLA